MNADTLLLRALKGAPLSCLLALRHGGKLGTSDIESITGYEQAAVTKALRDLVRLGLIVNTQRYGGWVLTPDAVQLPIFIPAQLETWEAGKTGLEAGKTGLPSESTPRPVQPVDNPVDNSGADPETVRLAKIVVDRLLCSRSRALQAISAARAAGALPAEIEIEILCWLAWLNDDQTNTKSLRNPGYFVTKKIAEREAAPPLRHIVTWSDDDRRIQALLRQLKRAGEDGDHVGEENA